MSQENVQVIRGLYEAFGKGDVATVLEHMDQRVEWREAENFIYADRNPYVGPQAGARRGVHATRDAWVEVANRAWARAIEIEVKCSDANEHRRRVETRISDIPGLMLPTWEEVVSREYLPWDREHLVIDTAGQTVEQSVNLLRELLRGR